MYTTTCMDALTHALPVGECVCVETTLWLPSQEAHNYFEFLSPYKIHQRYIIIILLSWFLKLIGSNTTT